MSKTLLKKELQHLDRDEVVQVLLDLYAARKEARDWLDFFADPDVDKRLDKAKESIARELNRGRGQSKARISHIRKTIKDFASLQPGEEATAGLMVYAIEQAYAASRRIRLSNTLIAGLQRLVGDTVAWLDDAGQLQAMMPRLQEATIALPARSVLKPYLADALQQLGTRALDRRRKS